MAGVSKPVDTMYKNMQQASHHILQWQNS